MKPLVICGWINAHTGYGQHCLEVVKYFTERGDARVRPIILGEQWAKVPAWVWKHCLFEAHDNPWELAILPSYYNPHPEKRTAWFTMWETDRIHERGRLNMNKCPLLIVPTEWGAHCLRESGVNPKIEVVPLGIDPNAYYAEHMMMDGPTYFGAAGRLKHGKTRKGVNQVVDLFLRAFPTDPNVRLVIKSFHDETELKAPPDSRIIVIREYLDDNSMRSYYGGLTCFVSAARGEGWGLMQHQAMACARPVIACPFGGLSAFMTKENSLSCRYELGPADGGFKGGRWAIPDEDHMIELMRLVHNDREMARQIGLRADIDARKLTWDAANRRLEQVLTKHGVI